MLRSLGRFGNNIHILVQILVFLIFFIQHRHLNTTVSFKAHNLTVTVWSTKHCFINFHDFLKFTLKRSWNCFSCSSRKKRREVPAGRATDRSVPKVSPPEATESSAWISFNRLTRRFCSPARQPLRNPLHLLSDQESNRRVLVFRWSPAAPWISGQTCRSTFEMKTHDGPDRTGFDDPSEPTSTLLFLKNVVCRM